MIVRDLMRHEVLLVGENLTLAELCDLFQMHRVHGAPVVDEGGRLRGFVSQEDILFGSMGASGSARGGRRAPGASKKKGGAPKVDLEPRVRDVMTSPAVTADEETDVVDLCQMMWRLRIHHVPVVERGRVTGIVAAMDLCRAVATGTIKV